MDFSRFVLHVGYPKTGSTWLQYAILPCAPEIEFWYPEHDRLSWLKSIALDHDRSFDMDVLRDRISKELQRVPSNKKVIVSWEVYSGDLFSGACDSHRIAERLSQLFPGATVLIMIREQLSMINSVYKQFIQEGGSLSLNAFLQLSRPSPIRFDLGHLEYDQLIEKYEALFGKDNVAVVPFEALASKSPDKLRSDLCSVLGIDEQLLERQRSFKGRTNVSVSNMSVFFMRVFNRLVYSHLNISPIFPRWLISARHVRFAFQRIFDPFFWRRLVARDRSLVTGPLRAKLSENFRSSNLRLASSRSIDLARFGYVMPAETTDHEGHESK